MRAVDLIRKKRDSGEHTREEIDFLISNYTRGVIPDYQMAAWLMASWLRGLSHAETAALTEAMLHSGEVLDFSSIPGKKVDKHSTGGVGDNTSLILAPIVAAGGLTVPMISGRGLGHTGGTLDKLESIPGFDVNLSLDRFRTVLRECGMGLIGQTGEIAPADKKIYALRDATGTVENRRTDLRFDHEQEAGGRYRRARARCEDRLWRFYEDGEDIDATGGVDGRYRRAHGQEGHRAGHRHGSAAGAICRALCGDHRVHRRAEGERSGGFARAEL